MPNHTATDDSGQIDPVGETAAVLFIGEQIGVPVAGEQLSNMFDNCSITAGTPYPMSWQTAVTGEAMMQGPHAKMVSPTPERAMREYLATTRSPVRDRVLFLVSMKAGLRATAMAS